MGPFRSPLQNQQQHKEPTAQSQAPSILGNFFCLECSAEFITSICYESKCCTVDQEFYQ